MYDVSALLAPLVLVGVMLIGIGLLYVRYRTTTIVILIAAPLAVFMLFFARLESIWWIIIIAADLALLIASLLVGIIKLIEIAEKSREDQRQLLKAIARMLLSPSDMPTR